MESPADDIPLLSRVIAVADAYNAMTSHRPYREAMPSRVARLRLAQAVENQFDTSVVAAFEAILASSRRGYRSARSEEFRPGQPSVAMASLTRRRAVLPSALPEGGGSQPVARARYAI